MRLLEAPAAERQLLAAVAAVPLGQRLHIPALRDALVNQADVLAALQRLVERGKLDRGTLRPRPERILPLLPRQRGASNRGFAIGKGEPSKPLLDALKAEGERRGFTTQQLSLAVWDNKARIYQLASAATVRRATANVVRAWIDRSREEHPELPQSPAPAVEAPVVVRKGEPAAGAVQPPAHEPQTAAELFAAVMDHCERHDLSSTRVGKHLFGGNNGLLRLRDGSKPQARTLAKLRAFLASAPSDDLRRRPAGGPRVADNGGITGAELAAKLDALIAEHGLSKSAVGQHLVGQSSGVATIRHSNPRRKTVERILAFLADPPLDQLKPRDAWATRRANQEKRAADGAEVIEVKGVRGLPARTPAAMPEADLEVHECGGCAPPVLTVRPAGKPKLSFEEQLARVERGEVGIAPNIRIGRPDPSGTLGGVTGEINL
jgi:hypothetical protein